MSDRLNVDVPLVLSKENGYISEDNCRYTRTCNSADPYDDKLLRAVDNIQVHECNTYRPQPIANNQP